IIETIPVAVPRDRLYIMKKIPAAFWDETAIQVKVAGMAGTLDSHSLSHFLNQLKAAKSVSPECLRTLSGAISGFSPNQIRSYLSLLERDTGLLKNVEILNAIRGTAADPDYQYSAFLKAFLTKHGIVQ